MVGNNTLFHSAENLRRFIAEIFRLHIFFSFHLSIEDPPNVPSSNLRRKRAIVSSPTPHPLRLLSPRVPSVNLGATRAQPQPHSRFPSAFPAVGSSLPHSSSYPAVQVWSCGLASVGRMISTQTNTSCCTAYASSRLRHQYYRAVPNAYVCRVFVVELGM